MTHPRAAGFAFVSCALALAACEPPKQPTQPDVFLAQCAASDECPAEHVCVDGSCILGACDPSLADACPQGFTCNPGTLECDEDVDEGPVGCHLCDEAAEWCCAVGLVCSAATDACVADTAPPCGAGDTCSDGLFCAGSRCVQCDADTPCGPGLACDSGVGRCYAPTDACLVDADCAPAERCSASLGACVYPLCTADADCNAADARRICDVDRFACVLPPAVCSETDEPNDSPAEASVATGDSYTATLCRGDSDFIAFAAEPYTAYEFAIDFGASGQGGVGVAILDANGAVVAFDNFAPSAASVILTHATDASGGPLVVRIVGASDERDSWNYTLSFVETELFPPADCSEQPEEPNDTQATATPVELGDTNDFALCDLADVDWYRVALAPNASLRAIIAGFTNGNANINAQLFDADGVQLDGSTTTNAVEILDADEGVGEAFVRVFRAGAGEAQVAYTLATLAVPRDESCAPDATEPDGTVALAATVDLTPNGAGNPAGGRADVIACSHTDVDFFRFELPQDRRGTATITFDQAEGDLDLALLDAAGALLRVSASSELQTGLESETVVALPATGVTQTFLLRVTTSPFGEQSTAQLYSLHIEETEAIACAEETPDNRAEDGLCIGEFVADPSLPCVNEGNRVGEPIVVTPMMCGVPDEDWWRVGPLDRQQVIAAHVTYTPGPTHLGVWVAANHGDEGAFVIDSAAFDGLGGGELVYSFVAPDEPSGLEYAFAVRTDPPADDIPYTLTLAIGPPCFDDDADLAGFDGSPATAIDVRPNPTPGVPTSVSSADASRCDGDTDVRRLLVFAGETVTVSLIADDSPAGMQASIGVGAADLNDPAVVVAGPILANDPALSYVSPTAQLLFVTVDVAPSAVVTGPYSLTIETQP